jgi:hypothetical protein
MSVKVMVELPDELAQRARAVAAQTQQRFEDVLLDWLTHAGAEPPVESLPDAQVLALCDAMLEAAAQEELSELLVCHREGSLGEADRSRLDELMRRYRRGLVRKAQALRTAVARGLRPQLS